MPLHLSLEGEVKLFLDGPRWEVQRRAVALHRHPDDWKQPNDFDPERWTRSTAPFAYLPFLIGPRKCMGQPMAELEMLVRISTILRNFDLEVGVDSAPLTPFLVPRFATDLPFRLSAAS